MNPNKNGYADAMNPNKNGYADAMNPDKNGYKQVMDPNKNGVKDAYYKSTEGAKKVADDIRNKITGTVDKVTDIFTNPLFIVGGVVLLIIVMK
jgi:hypothetical protein